MKSVLPVAVMMLCATVLTAQSPDEQMWLGFVEWNPGTPRVPEDETMGLLADRRRPDASWEGALDACDAVFGALASGEVPVDYFLPAMKVPLTRDFTALLQDGPIEVNLRYGRPIRQDSRVSVPLRAAADDIAVYGWVYLGFIEGNWLIEQWALDLSDLPKEPAR